MYSIKKLPIRGWSGAASHKASEGKRKDCGNINRWRQFDSDGPYRMLSRCIVLVFNEVCN